MASVTVTLTGICGGGSHLTFSSTGASEYVSQMTLDDLQSALTEQEREAFIKCIAKLVKVGRTQVQTRTVLQAGVTVTV